MRGPTTSPTRLHAPVNAVRDILQFAAAEVDDRGDRSAVVGGSAVEIHRREQVLLLARLAPDTGARRGELAALQIGDLDADVLTISRATSNELASAHNLAADLREPGRYQQAGALDEDTLARRRRVLGDNHPDTLTSADNLAADLRELGKPERI